MCKILRICGFNIEITSPSFPEEDCFFDAFEVNTETSDIKINCTLTDSLNLPDEMNLTSENYISACKIDELIYRYQPMGTDLGSLSVYNQRNADSVNVEIYSSNAKVLLDRRYFWNTLSFSQIMLTKKVLIFHAAFINYKNQGIIFSAPSGTGKSTQAELWKNYRNAEIINGDKTGIAINEKGVFSCGVPFCGTSAICKNVTVPLKAIVLLYQGTENKIAELNGISAISELIKNIHLDFTAPDEMNSCISLLSEILKNVKVISFSCTPDENAVTALENFLFPIMRR